MALTNAERQARYRERLKAAASGGAGRWADELLAVYEGVREQYREDGHAYPLEEFLRDLLRNEFPDLLGPILSELIGLPRDPWPGLTERALADMTKDRMSEAKKRALNPVGDNDFEVGFLTKLRAAKNREWLERGRRR